MSEVTDSAVQSSCRVLDAVASVKPHCRPCGRRRRSLSRDVAVAASRAAAGQPTTERRRQTVGPAVHGDLERRLRCAYASFCWPFSFFTL